MRFLTAAAAAVAIAALAGSAAIPAAHATSPPGLPAITAGNLNSDNWAGYWGKSPAKAPLMSVNATFTVPDVSNQATRGSAPYAASMWVGIGGIENGAMLEQDGLLIYKQWPWSAPEYVLFWEIVPGYTAQPFTNPDGSYATVQPGDVIHASVTEPAFSASGRWDFTVIVGEPGTDGARTYTHLADIPASANTGKTAEVITEWPSGPAWASFGLLNEGFIRTGNVRYTYADMVVRGQPKPYPLPVTQNKVSLREHAYGGLVIYPGSPMTSDPWNSALDSFYTFTK